jgi:hypothetical protein
VARAFSPYAKSKVPSETLKFQVSKAPGAVRRIIRGGNFVSGLAAG